MKARHLDYKPQTQDREGKFQQHTFNNGHITHFIFSTEIKLVRLVCTAESTDYTAKTKMI